MSKQATATATATATRSMIVIYLEMPLAHSKIRAEPLRTQSIAFRVLPPSVTPCATVLDVVVSHMRNKDVSAGDVLKELVVEEPEKI